MAINVQDLMDRRHLRRKLTFWRVAAILVVAVAVLVLPFALDMDAPGRVRVGDYIARVSIEGAIWENEDLLDLMEGLKENDAVKAVILRIDSPGGTTVGGETLFNAAREIALVKPVAAEVGTLAASAGYMVATAADHIVARHTSIVGSIGVIFQYVDASDLLHTIGLDVNAVKSSPMKAEPSPFGGPPPQEAIAMIRRLVMDSYQWFVDLVAERRPLSESEVLALADGSIYTGMQALEYGLIDALGGEAEIRLWLESERDVPEGLEIIDRAPPDDDFGFSLFAGAKAAFFGFLGLDPEAGSLREALGGTGAHLDGLVSLWQPPRADMTGR